MSILREQDEREIWIGDHLRNLVSTLEIVARYHGIKFITSENEIPSIYINIGYLDQIILNLFDNSIDQIPLIRKRTGKIEISLHHENKNNKSFIIEFSDNGPGIHEKYRDKVFDLFFTTKPSGTGLGLYISKGLIKSLGGKISIGYNVRLSGTTFILELPIKTQKE